MSSCTFQTVTDVIGCGSELRLLKRSALSICLSNFRNVFFSQPVTWLELEQVWIKRDDSPSTQGAQDSKCVEMFAHIPGFDVMCSA